MEFTFRTQLHYLIHAVDGEYVAHCLDADLVGTGKSKAEAIEELNLAVRMLAFYAISSNVFDIMSLCKQAPERYWQKFESAKRTSGTEEHELEVCPDLPLISVQQGDAARPHPVEPVFKKREFTYCVAEFKKAA
jgi:hypothetical protein